MNVSEATRKDIDEFRPPKVYIGETVLYYRVAGELPTPAIVTSVNARSINLSVITENSMTLDPVENVFHTEDPIRRTYDEPDVREQHWCYHPLFAVLHQAGQYGKPGKAKAG